MLDQLQPPLETNIFSEQRRQCSFFKTNYKQRETKKKYDILDLLGGLCTFLSESHQILTKHKIYELHSGGSVQNASEQVNI